MPPRSIPGILVNGKAIMELFEKLFQNIMLVASLGAGFGFTVLLTPDRRPAPGSDFDSVAVNTIVASSWLLFILSLTISTALSTYLFFDKENLARALTDREVHAHVKAFLASLVVQLLVLGGFITASLAVSAFSKVIGYVALAFTLLATLLFVGFSLKQLRGFFKGE